MKGAGWRRCREGPPHLAPGFGVNRAAAGTRWSLPARLGLGDGAHLGTRPALFAWHRAREGQALVWREVSHQRVELRKGNPFCPKRSGHIYFVCVCVLFLIPSDWLPTKSGF